MDNLTEMHQKRVYTYHFHAVDASETTVDGIMNLYEEVTTMERYIELKRVISDKFGLRLGSLVIESFTRLS